MPPKPKPQAAGGVGSLTTDGEAVLIAVVAAWPLQCALVTVVGTESAAGTEVTGGSYARKAITLGTPILNSVGNTNTILYSNMPACTVVGADIWNTSTTKRVLYGLLPAPITVLAGGSIEFGPGDLLFDID
jgi:hypothetical protein